MPSSFNTQLISTVKENKSFFTNQDILLADKACQLQEYIGWPSTTNFKKYVCKYLLVNCSTTVSNIDQALLIYGPPAPLLKEKMTQALSSQVNYEKSILPPKVASNYSTIHVYIFFL